MTENKDAETRCENCDGNGWRAEKSKFHRLLPGTYEVNCDTCGGHGWVVEDEGNRP